MVGISKQDIEDIYEIRLHIEGLATARCAQIITDQQLQRLKEIINMEIFYTERGTSDEIKDVDGRFHEFIYEHCGSNIFCTTLPRTTQKNYEIPQTFGAKPGACPRGAQRTSNHLRCTLCP